MARLLMYHTERFIPKSYPKLDNQRMTVINKAMLGITRGKRFLFSNQVRHFNLDSEILTHTYTVIADKDHLWHGNMRTS